MPGVWVWVLPGLDGGRKEPDKLFLPECRLEGGLGRVALEVRRELAHSAAPELPHFRVDLRANARHERQAPLAELIALQRAHQESEEAACEGLFRGELILPFQWGLRFGFGFGFGFRLNFLAEPHR